MYTSKIKRIKEKTINQEPLDREELAILWGIVGGPTITILGSGTNSKRVISNIKKNRDGMRELDDSAQDDIADIFECDKDQVARGQKNLNNSTRILFSGNPDAEFLVSKGKYQKLRAIMTKGVIYIDNPEDIENVQYIKGIVITNSSTAEAINERIEKENLQLLGTITVRMKMDW